MATSRPTPDTAALRVGARHGLAPAGSPVVLRPEDSARVLSVARIDRLGGLLTAAIREGLIRADGETSQALAEIWQQQLVASVVVEALVVRVAQTLDEAGVTWRLTKGAAVAHLDYPDPAMRPFGDADILVHPQSWARAVEALRDAGCRRTSRELEPGWENRFGKGVTLKSPEGLEVDMHRRFAIGRYGALSRMADLYGEADHIMLAERPVPTLDGPGRLMHSCHHAALGGFRHYRAHRDIAQQLLVTGVDWQSTVHLASRWRVQAVIAQAITDAWRILDLPQAHPAHDWALRTPIGWADRRALAVFAAEKPFRHQALTAVPVLPWRDVPAYLRPLVARPGAARRLVGRPWRRLVAGRSATPPAGS